MSESVEMLLTLKIFQSNKSPVRRESSLPERENLNIPQLPDHRDVRELGAPTVELLDLVEITDPGAGHDHVLAEFDHLVLSTPAACHGGDAALGMLESV